MPTQVNWRSLLFFAKITNAVRDYQVTSLLSSKPSRGSLARSQNSLKDFLCSQVFGAHLTPFPLWLSPSSLTLADWAPSLLAALLFYAHWEFQSPRTLALGIFCALDTSSSHLPACSLWSLKRGLLPDNPAEIAVSPPSNQSTIAISSSIVKHI